MIVCHIIAAASRVCVGAGVVDRKFVPITGGGLVSIKGPCFSNPNNKLTCKFEHVHMPRIIRGHVSQTEGKIAGPSSALCPLPLFNRLGPSVLNISDNNGATFKFHVVLNVGKNVKIGGVRG